MSEPCEGPVLTSTTTVLSSSQLSPKLGNNLPTLGVESMYEPCEGHGFNSHQQPSVRLQHTPQKPQKTSNTLESLVVLKFIRPGRFRAVKDRFRFRYRS